MKKILLGVIACVMSLSLIACSEDDGKLKIGVIQYAEHPALDKAYEGFMKAMEDNGYGEDKVTYDFQNAQGDQSNCETIATKFVNDESDLVYAIATPTAQAVANKTDSIPIVISAVTDPKTSGLVKSNEKPGTNVTGTSDLTPVDSQIDLLTQLIPDAKKVAVMYCSAEDNSIYQAKLAVEKIESVGLEAVEYTVADSNQIQQVAESMIGKVDAVYIPTDNLLAEGMSTVAMVFNENNLPCIVGEEGMCENGGLATYGIDYYNLGYMAGEQAVKILKGEAKAKNMPIEYLASEECTLVINSKVASQLGITISEDLLSKATVIGE